MKTTLHEFRALNLKRNIAMRYLKENRKNKIKFKEIYEEHFRSKESKKLLYFLVCIIFTLYVFYKLSISKIKFICLLQHIFLIYASICIAFF